MRDFAFDSGCFSGNAQSVASAFARRKAESGKPFEGVPVGPHGGEHPKFLKGRMECGRTVRDRGVHERMRRHGKILLTQRKGPQASAHGDGEKKRSGNGRHDDARSLFVRRRGTPAHDPIGQNGRQCHKQHGGREVLEYRPVFEQCGEDGLRVILKEPEDDGVDGRRIKAVVAEVDDVKKCRDGIARNTCDGCRTTERRNANADDQKHPGGQKCDGEPFEVHPQTRDKPRDRVRPGERFGSVGAEKDEPHDGKCDDR